MNIFDLAYEELQNEGNIITVDKVIEQMFVIRRRLDTEEKNK